MALPSPLYIAFQGLQTLFNDKDTATALSGGYVEFYRDTNRSTPKDVYQQTQLIDNTYEFVNIGSVVSLNVSGAFESPDDGTDIQVYAYPFENNPDDPEGTGDVDLYFLKVFSADDVLQFTREAQPANSPLISASDFVDTTNEISNPQFVQVNFEIPTTVFNVTGTDTVTNIAPDWDIITTGTGTLTVGQVPILSAPIDGNPPYVLSITSLGLSGNEIQLRQRFDSSPRLLLNSFISGSILARSQNGVAVPFTMTYVPSDVTAESFVIFDSELTALDGSYNTISGTVDTSTIDASTDTAPNGYVDIIISFTSNVQVYISNIQIIGVEDETSSSQFIEETYARQIDHLYHYAYPIVPIGTIIDYFGFSIPSHYLLCDYTAYNRVQYSQLFNTITMTETVALTSGLATFTVADGSVYSIGYGVEGTGIPGSTTIIGISTNIITISSQSTVTASNELRFYAAGNRFQETVTWQSATTFTVANGAAYKVGEAITGTGVLSATVITVISTNLITISNATAYVISNTSLVYFYDAANGDQSTTFNVPDMRRRGTIGSGGVVISASPLGIGNHFGNVGGEESHTQLIAELAAHTHPGSTARSNSGSPGGSVSLYGSSAAPNQNLPIDVATQGNGTPFNLYEPSLVTSKCIRYQ